jgi:hypothetical protein
MPKHEEVVFAGDASKAAVAWARTARLLPESFADKRREYRSRAVRAFEWANHVRPSYAIGFSWINHGAPSGFVPPAEVMTRDLLMLAWVALELVLAGLPEYEAEAVALADAVLERQVPRERAEFGLFGHFTTFRSGALTEKAWVHHLNGGTLGADAGGHFPHYLIPLLRLCTHWPHHPAATRWHQAIRDFAYGYLVPACGTSPFQILPLGCFPGEGVLHFAGLWHGMNAAYALTAALALELRLFLDDPAFDAIATGNLQWIAGLNAGLTAESLSASHMFSTSVPCGVALPVSMICGIGRRGAGNWLNVRGSICNGFSTGDQFRHDVLPTLANDGPHTFTDEDWITHAGGWLSALAREKGSGKPA